MTDTPTGEVRAFYPWRTVGHVPLFDMPTVASRFRNQIDVCQTEFIQSLREQGFVHHTRVPIRKCPRKIDDVIHREYAPWTTYIFIGRSPIVYVGFVFSETVDAVEFTLLVQ